MVAYGRGDKRGSEVGNPTIRCLFLNMVDTSKRKDGKEKREAPIPIGSQ